MGFLSRFKGRERGSLSPEQNMDVLKGVKEKLSSCMMMDQPFKLRETVADVLTEKHFDDTGVGCKQEVFISGLVAQACGLSDTDLAQAQTALDAMTDAKQRKAVMDTAVRYAQ